MQRSRSSCRILIRALESASRARFVAFLGVAILALAPASVHAEVFAAIVVPAPAPRTDLDIAIVNAAGRRVALPPGVNTTAYEIYPSVSSDGRRLLFRRFGGSDGQRVLLVDLTTGALAEVFSNADLFLRPALNSTLSSDGQFVYTGRSLRQDPFFGSAFYPIVTQTDVRAFPAGPFPRRDFQPRLRFSGPGRVADVAVTDGDGDRLFDFRSEIGLALRVVLSASGRGQLAVALPYEQRFFHVSDPDIDFGRPVFAVAPPDGLQLFFEKREYGGPGRGLDSSIALLNPCAFCVLPDWRTADFDESQPAVTSDRRYWAWVRHDADGHDRLFFYDRVTLTRLNSIGVDMGLTDTRTIGNVSLYQKAVITTSVISRSGNVTATLADGSSIGILVQRIVGESRSRGEVEYELEMVGRVPLGWFDAGHASTQWDLTVDGQPLAPGRYLVTLRAVEDDGVRELGKPHVLHIPDNHGQPAR